MVLNATDWGTGGASTFVSVHSDPPPSTDPSLVTLPPSFTVCIVGASRGIGAGIAYGYTRAGASTLILASRRLSGLQTVAAACRKINPNIAIEIVSCDIASAPSVASLAETIKTKFGRLDVAVANSGYSGPVVLKVTETDPETFAQATNVNYVGTFHCAKYLVPLLLGTEGGARGFVAIGSFAALLVRGPVANSQYCVSKAAQLKLVEHVHEEYSGQGLKAWNVHPGAVRSEMAEETAPAEFMEYLKDSPDLAGAFCVWLTKDGGDERAWLSGRQISACWDVEELEARREEIVSKDLLKLKLTL